MKTKLKIIMALISLILIMPMIFAITWGSEGNTQTQFNSGGAPECVNNGERWIFPGGAVISSLTNCSIGNYPTCCPQGSTCNATSSCVVNTVPILSCGDYKTSDTCENFNILNVRDTIYNIFIENLGLDIGPSELHFCSQTGYAPFRYGTGSSCKEYWNCACEWDSTTNTCLSRYYSNNCTDVDDGNDDVARTSYCDTSIQSSDNQCGGEDDVYRVSWTGINYVDNQPQGSTASCKDGSKEFPCPLVSAVSFFTFFNLIISCLVIAGVYLTCFRFRRK